MELVLSFLIKLIVALSVFTILFFFAGSRYLVEFVPLRCILRRNGKKEEELSKFEKFRLIFEHNFSYVLFWQTIVRLRYSRYVFEGIYDNGDDEIVLEELDLSGENEEYLKKPLVLGGVLNFATGFFVWGYLIFMGTMLVNMIIYNKEH